MSFDQISFPSWFVFTRPLASIDIESTQSKPGGQVDAATDRIIDLAVTKVMSDGYVKRYQWRVHPGVAITPGSTECHGITDADVDGLQHFQFAANEVLTALEGCDLVGFNLHRYDIPLLYEELARNGVMWNLSGVQVFDAGVIFKRQEERTLSAAVQFYLGREHDGAHGATADADAAVEVLSAQLSRYKDLAQMGFEDVAKYSVFFDPKKQMADIHGKLYRDAGGNLCYNFGKHQGCRVVDQMRYAVWMLGSDFPAHTKTILDLELLRIKALMDHAVQQKYAAMGFN